MNNVCIKSQIIWLAKKYDWLIKREKFEKFLLWFDWLREVNWEKNLRNFYYDLIG